MRTPTYHRPSWDQSQVIVGLHREKCGDRWRICATGQQFRERDEAKAIARYREWESRQKRRDVEPIRLPVSGGTPSEQTSSAIALAGRLEMVTHEPEVRWEYRMPGEAYWAHLRQVLLLRLDEVRQKTGLDLSVRLGPDQAPRLDHLVETYCTHAQVGRPAQRRARRIWQDFVTVTGAERTSDLSPSIVFRWADKIRKRGLAACTVKNTFTVVKTVLGFAMERPERDGDQKFIREAIDACAVLTNPKGTLSFAPKPISPRDFRKLLAAARGDDRMVAALLLSLNAALYASEVVSVKWDQLDLQKGVYVGHRGKTGVARVATVWARTIAALRRLPRSGDYVIMSSRGTALTPNAFRKLFEDLRAKAGLPQTEHNQIRDASVSVAAEVKDSDNLCRALAGHRTPGLTDAYWLRRPQRVRPACEQIEREFFGRTGRASQAATAASLDASG